jgi:putative IMPACT (imprinted ancient) family translation regulator
VLRGRDVSDVVAVVSRHFGGVLLGAGGLVRAYSDTVRAALDDVGVLERRLLEKVDISVEHADAGKLENELRARDVAVLGVDYADRATLHVALPAGDLRLFSAVLAELSGGTSVAEPVGSEWVDG